MMKRKFFSEEQIIRIVKEAEAIRSVREVCGQHNFTEQAFYRWRNKFGGMDVAEAKQLGEFQRENADLKDLVGKRSLSSDRDPT